MTESFASKLIDATLEEELGQSFGRYARTTILSRAIPDVRDGLKPVQRRIVYAMYLAGNTQDKRYRKCAKTVGDVMGSFHPHGDSSIYEAMVRLAQDWKLRHPLVDGHGNFGSIDDDPAAAMRYTEARLAALADELTRDIKKDTVSFAPTFDDSEVEPTVLPSRYPNLLVNGTSGVSTGFATEIQPHNLGEVIDALIALIDEPAIDLDGLMAHIKGPDFPTGGIMMGVEGLRQAYETGRGRVVLRGRSTIETTRDRVRQIVVTEIPYGVIKANLVRQIERLRLDKVVPGIRDVRDESDREGLRMVVDLKRGVEAEPVLAFIHKKTDLQVYRHFQMVAISNRTPVLMGLKDILEAYLKHQHDVVTRRSRFDLARAEARLHIVGGLIKAVDILDEIIATIRGSKHRAQAHARLVKRFEFSDEQAKEILDLRLHRLTGLQILQLRQERDALQAEIEGLSHILGSDQVLMDVVRRELLEVRKRFADERRTTILGEVEKVEKQIAVTVTVKEQAQVVGVSQSGYVKRCSVASFAATETSGVRDGDLLRWTLQSNTLHHLLVVTARGKGYAIPVHQLPEAKWGDVGTALVNVVGLDKGDAIVAALNVESFDRDTQVLFGTRLGAIKRSPLKSLSSQRTSGVVVMKMADNDGLLSAQHVVDAGGDLMMVTTEGNCIRFPLAEIPTRGRSAGGVRGMRLNSREQVIAILQVSAGDDGELGLVTAEGRAKRSRLRDFPRQRRGGRGVRGLRKRVRDPHEVATAVWWPSWVATTEQLRLVTSEPKYRDRPVASLQNAARDGLAYEFEMLADGIAVVGGFLLGVKPEGDEPPHEPEPRPESEAPEQPTDAAPLTASGGDRGGWAQRELFGTGVPIPGSDSNESSAPGSTDAEAQGLGPEAADMAERFDGPSELVNPSAS